jgi:putative ABC transport system permease protein
LVARSIYDVLPIRDSLKAMGIEVYTRASEIETMQTLDRVLGRVYWLIAGLATTGFLASLTANLLANVDRKRRDLSMLRLIGFPTASLVMFPITQASLVALLGSLLALGGYWIVAQMLNAYFVSSLQQGELICKLLPRHAVIAVLATVLCAVAAAAWPGMRASRIQPAEGVRDV